MYRNILIDIPEQLKAWLDAKKGELMADGITEVFPDVSSVEVFDHCDINLNVKSGIYMAFIACSNIIGEKQVEYTWELPYVEQYGDRKTRSIVGRKRTQSIFRLLMAFQPRSAGRLVSLKHRAGFLKDLGDAFVTVFELIYAQPSRSLDNNWNN